MAKIHTAQIPTANLVTATMLNSIIEFILFMTCLDWPSLLAEDTARNSIKNIPAGAG